MNERIKELAEQADIQFYKSYVPETGFKYEGTEVTVEDLKNFAELIVRECAGINYNSSFKDGEFHARELLEHFGVEETQGWVCPNCGTDRTKAACPKGHTAALTGDCPMHGVAHGAAQ